MPALSFSALEILPALLDHSKTQTIRPLMRHRLRTKFVTSHGIEHSDLYEHIPRFKVGDVVTLYWKMRSKAKWYVYPNYTTKQDVGFLTKEGAMAFAQDQMDIIDNKPIAFTKLRGKVKITEVFTIEMQKCSNDINAFHLYREQASQGSQIVHEMAKRDGFRSAEEMFEWFDAHYDLLQPRGFAVYRWFWL